MADLVRRQIDNAVRLLKLVALDPNHPRSVFRKRIALGLLQRVSAVCKTDGLTDLLAEIDAILQRAAEPKQTEFNLTR